MTKRTSVRQADGFRKENAAAATSPDGDCSRCSWMEYAWKSHRVASYRIAPSRARRDSTRSGTRRRRGGYVKGLEGGNVCAAQDRRRYLDTVKRIHDAMLHDPSDGAGRHVHDHRVGGQVLVFVFIHDHGRESRPLNECASGPPLRCRAIHALSLSFSLFSSSYRTFFPSHFRTLSPRPSAVLADDTFALPIRRSRSIPEYRDDGEEDDGVTRQRVAETSRIRTDRGETLHARGHAIACVDRFLMGLYRGAEEARWPPVPCPRPVAHEYGTPLPSSVRPTVSLVSLVRLIDLIEGLVAWTSGHGDRAAKRPRQRATRDGDPDRGGDGEVRSGRTCRACVVRDHVVRSCRPRFVTGRAFERTGCRMNMHILCNAVVTTTTMIFPDAGGEGRETERETATSASHCECESRRVFARAISTRICASRSPWIRLGCTFSTALTRRNFPPRVIAKTTRH